MKLPSWKWIAWCFFWANYWAATMIVCEITEFPFEIVMMGTFAVLLLWLRQAVVS